jgi:hypothetical protein
MRMRRAFSQRPAEAVSASATISATISLCAPGLRFGTGIFGAARVQVQRLLLPGSAGTAIISALPQSIELGGETMPGNPPNFNDTLTGGGAAKISETRNVA